MFQSGARPFGMAVLVVLLWSNVSSAQVTPAATSTPPDDTPSVRVGGTLFIDFTDTLEPEIVDADGNRVDASAFNVSRAYINVTGQLNHLIAFRITPDVTRESGTGSSLSGSLTYRLKYGYVQVNLDDWLWHGTYVRMGATQTPWIDFEETIYRYRFQGTIFVDREGYLSSSDYGVAFRTQFPNDYGEVMAGVYNGEGYTRSDPNNQKAFQVRGTVRPFAGPGTRRGLRVSGFYDGDHYVRDAERRRFVSLVSFEHKFVNAGWVYLDAADQTSVRMARIDSHGHSFWVTPRSTIGFEGLLRYDRLDPDEDSDSRRERWIAGVAYWPPVAAGLSSSFLLDYEEVRHHRFTPSRPTEKRIAVHALVSF